MERGRGGFNRRRGARNYRNQSRNQSRPRKMEESRAVGRSELPIYQSKESIMYHIEKFDTTIIESPTGSGKSTQIPQYINERFPDYDIVVAQPLKISASDLANRVAEEMNSNLGGLVGVMFKGETIRSDHTRITFTTTDTLLENVLNEDFAWDFIIIDEVHERSLETDLLLAIIKLRMNEGKQFRLIIMSATIQKVFPAYLGANDIRKPEPQGRRPQQEEEINWNDSSESEEEEKSSLDHRNNFQDPADILSSSSRLFDIEEIYLEKVLEIINPLNSIPDLQFRPLEFIDFASMFSKDADTNPLEILKLLYELASRIILVQHLKLYRDEDRPFTFLVFLPGAYEINLMFENLVEILMSRIAEFEIIQLHANIPEDEYQKIFIQPEVGKRRVILSSNIAESSLTLPDVRFIIDFGLNRETSFNNQRNSDSFELVWAAKSMMRQRAGRAGRVANGVVFRLMPMNFFNSMLYEYAKPEIQRSTLDKIILKLKQKNIENVRDLLGNILEAPDDIEIIKTEKYLIEMGALNFNKNLTDLGQIYSNFPFEIRVTRICMIGILFNCFKEAMILGALISLNRAPIKSFTSQPGNQSKSHKRTYMNRLIFSGKSNSDIIMMLSAYRRWYDDSGRKIKHYIYQNNRRITTKPRISEQERQFCDHLSIDPILMREARSIYCEIKQKFKTLGVDPRYYSQKHGYKAKFDSSDSFLFKLCIAASFPGKYLISHYEMLDQVSRERLVGKIGPNYKHSLLIPDIPNSVTPNDIESLIAENRQKPKDIKIIYSNCIIEYNENVNPNTLKYVMWLGSYGRRYYNLAWVLLKRVTRDVYNRIMKKELLGITVAEFNKVHMGQRRPGVVVDVNHVQNDKSYTVDEVIFLAKPEYPFKLSFKDMFSRSDVIIEDESVNCHSFTTDPEISQKFMLVCSEYIQRKNITIGKQSTLMPFYPLLPHLMSLIFSSRIEYIPNLIGNRYKGIRFVNYDSFLYFDYGFTSEDARMVNKIRKDIAEYLGNPKIIENADLIPPVLSDIQNLLQKPRLQINLDLPDWRDIIDFPKQTIAYKAGLEDLTSIPLLTIDEDDSLYHSEETQKIILSKKIKYLKDLEKNCNLSLATKTELVCIDCQECICEPNSVTFEADVKPLFKIVPQYGKTESSNILPYKNQFTQFIEENYDLDSWELCRNHHVIGWNIEGDTLISDKSNVGFRLPGGKIVRLTNEIWNNEFYELKLMAEKEKSEFEKVKFSYECLICDEKLKRNNEFFSHLQGQEHKRLADMFLQPYISNF